MSETTELTKGHVFTGAAGTAIQLTPKGAVFQGEVEADLVEDVITKLAAADTAARFAIGDLTNYLTSVNGKTLAEVARKTGLSADDLKKTAATCQRIPHAQRHPQLHFDFHLEAAALAVDEADQWLKVAEKEAMSRKQFKRSLQLGRVATEEDLQAPTQPDDAIDNVFPAVNRLVAVMGKIEREDLDDMDGHDLLGYFEDVFPVIEKISVIAEALVESEDGVLIMAAGEMLDDTQFNLDVK